MAETQLEISPDGSSSDSAEAVAQSSDVARTRPGGIRGFVQRVSTKLLLCFAILYGIGVVITLGIASMLDGNVTDVSGPALYVVAGVFFFRVLQFHLACVAALLAVIALSMRYRNVAALQFAVALLLAIPYLRSYFPKSPPVVAGSSLRIYSANLFSSNRDGEAIVRSIRAADADVIVLIETSRFSGPLITQEFGTAYPYMHRPYYDGGAIVMSRVPFRIEKPGVRHYGRRSRVPLVFTLGGRELAMYPVHLLSPRSLSLIAENREQMREFLDIDQAEQRPMVIVGDCNLTRLTPNFGALREAGFRSSYELIGFGLCNTWGPRRRTLLYQLPGVQIDQILIQQPLTAKSHHVGLDTGSDHRAIVAEIGFAE